MVPVQPSDPDPAATAPPAADAPAGRLDAVLNEFGVDGYMERVSPLLTEYGFRAVGAIVFLLFSLWFAKWVGNLVRRGLERGRVEITLVAFLSKAARIAIVVMAVVTCLSIFGVPSTMFATAIGAAGLAIGLGLQGSLSNISAGAMLAIFRPFRIGDVVVLSGHTGKVAEIDLFTTRIDTGDNRRIILPNSEVFGKVIENMTYNPVRRTEFVVGVDYGADLDRTRAVLEEAVQKTPGRAITPAPAVVLSGFGDSAVNWTIWVWAAKADFLSVKQAAAREVWYALEKAGIGIPFPQRVVHFHDMDRKPQRAGSSDDTSPEAGAAPAISK